jgi:hypothetical protein
MENITTLGIDDDDVQISDMEIFFCLNPLLFASCTDTFSKWCKITRGMKRSAQ